MQLSPVTPGPADAVPNWESVNTGTISLRRRRRESLYTLTLTVTVRDQHGSRYTVTPSRDARWGAGDK